MQKEKNSLKQKSLQVSSAQCYCTSLSLQTFSINRNNRTFDCRYDLDALQPICFLRSCIASLLRCMPRAVQITHRIESENVILSSDEVMMNVHWHYCHDTRNSDAGQSSIVKFDINTYLESHNYSFPLALRTTVAFALGVILLFYYSCIFIDCSYWIFYLTESFVIYDLDL